VEQNGFAYQEHLVTTNDGYILKMFRIPGFKGESPNGKKVAFMQHGILDSADCWIMHKSEFAPALMLSRAGYDVWLGNTRGNKYSHDHQGSISNFNKWDFDFETMGDLDITKEIDYVLQVTG
jgi:alpha-beta hydrolase superfamily lysophospholipase